MCIRAAWFHIWSISAVVSGTKMGGGDLWMCRVTVHPLCRRTCHITFVFMSLACRETPFCSNVRLVSILTQKDCRRLTPSRSYVTAVWYDAPMLWLWRTTPAARSRLYHTQCQAVITEQKKDKWRISPLSHRTSSIIRLLMLLNGWLAITWIQE